MLHPLVRSSLAASFVLSAAFLAGCSNPYDAEQTVTVKLTGATDETDREEIQESLKTMTDGSGHWISSSSSGDETTIQLAPVGDVDAFAEKIDFGEVTFGFGEEE